MVSTTGIKPTHKNARTVHANLAATGVTCNAPLMTALGASLAKGADRAVVKDCNTYYS